MKPLHWMRIVLPFIYLICYIPVMSQDDLHSVVSGLRGLEGKPESLESPFVAAGNRLYLIGFQNGTFPDLGWHIKGEMGGIWDHPIKLMDGFSVQLHSTQSGNSLCLNSARRFVNYPIGNHHEFHWAEEKMIISRFQFVPDDMEGMIVEFKLVNNGANDQVVQFDFTGSTDLRPTWLAERMNIFDTEDHLTLASSSRFAIGADQVNNWFVGFGSSMTPDKFREGPGPCAVMSVGMGKSGTLSYTLKIPANGGEAVIPFFIAGSMKDSQSVHATLNKLQEQGPKKLERKIARYKELRTTARIRIPDKEIEEMYEWLKYNTDWLVREVPGQGLGLSAGLPDYPWWFGCDNAYALQGVLASGNHQLAKATIELLADISNRTNNNGRIIHEVSTNGAVYNPGNTNETAQFIHLVWVYYTWTGDKALISKVYPFLQQGIRWLRQMDTDNNQYPNGSGMIEIHGLDSEMIDVVVYTQQALSAMSRLAIELNDIESSAEYIKQADHLKQMINEEWWSEASGSYADFRSTDADALPIIKAAMIRADTLRKDWSVAELKDRLSKLNAQDSVNTRAQLVYHNWVVNTPLETGIADRAKGRTALVTNQKYENAFGVYVTGLDRSIDADSVVLAARKKVFSYTGAVMTLPTGIQAIAAANYGSPDASLEYIKKLQKSFSYVLPGSMYEVSPDFGMFTQAWNIYGVAVPIIQKFFGIEPVAYKRAVVFSPNLPTTWNDVTLENLLVGDNMLTFTAKKSARQQEFTIGQSKPDWTIYLQIKGRPKKVVLNGKELHPKLYPENTLNLSGKGNVVRVFY